MIAFNVTLYINSNMAAQSGHHWMKSNFWTKLLLIVLLSLYGMVCVQTYTHVACIN